MPNVTRRRTGEMLRQLFEVLLPAPEGIQARDALAALEKRLTLSEYEQGDYASAAGDLRELFALRLLIWLRRAGFSKRKADGL